MQTQLISLSAKDLSAPDPSNPGQPPAIPELVQQHIQNLAEENHQLLQNRISLVAHSQNLFNQLSKVEAALHHQRGKVAYLNQNLQQFTVANEAYEKEFKKLNELGEALKAERKTLLEQLREAQATANHWHSQSKGLQAAYDEAVKTNNLLMTTKELLSGQNAGTSFAS